MIVVTGGAGFIGSNIVAALATNDGRDVAVCDMAGDGDKWRNLSKHTLADEVLHAKRNRLASCVFDPDVGRHRGEIERKAQGHVDYTVAGERLTFRPSPHDRRSPEGPLQ